LLRQKAPRQLLVWLSHVDVELLVVLLKRWLVIERIPEDVDYTEASDKLPPYTLDNVFYWITRNARDLPLLKAILSTLFEMDQVRYFQILESVISLNPNLLSGVIGTFSPFSHHPQCQIEFSIPC
jgi:hypothetical protein